MINSNRCCQLTSECYRMNGNTNLVLQPFPHLVALGVCKHLSFNQFKKFKAIRGFLRLFQSQLRLLEAQINSDKMSQGGGTTPAGGNPTTLQATGGGVVFSKVFIQRDYSEGTSVKFHTRLPTELEGMIERHVFEATINRLNEFYAEAEEGSCGTYCEGCIGCITAYLIYMCSETHYEKTLRKISKFVASQNERIYNAKGLQLIDPTYRGLRVIEITIFDRPGRT